MKDDIKEELREAAREVCRQLEREQERITEEAERLKSFMFTLESTEEVLQENERLQEVAEKFGSLGKSPYICTRKRARTGGASTMQRHTLTKVRERYN